MKQQHILFSMICPPKQGPGSPIIIDRHFKRLPNNWKISIVAPENSFIGIDFPRNWNLIPIPQRRWWWLPYRVHLAPLLALRLWYWQQECERIFAQERPTAILTVLHDVYSVFAAHLSRHWKIPLSVILHDQEELWTKSETDYRRIQRNWQTVLNQAARIWFVSQEMSHVYPISGKAKQSVLLPIPEGINTNFLEWKDKFRSAPVLGYAGSFYPNQITHFEKIASVLKQLNGTLLLITPKERSEVAQLVKNYSNIEHHELFNSNSEAIKFLGDHASSILISYPLDLDQYPWASTCFPSKLVEFSHLGLPVVILGSRHTALSQWAIQNHWLSYLDRLDEATLFNLLKQLTQKEFWLSAAEAVRKAALTDFDPYKIQAQFESELITKISSSK